METIKVKNCNSCPFLYSEYDDFATGYSTLDICVLAEFKREKNYIVSSHDNCGANPKNKTPKWCPLIKNTISVELLSSSTN